MAIFKGAKNHDDNFSGGLSADSFYFAPLDLTASDVIVGGGGLRPDKLQFTVAGSIDAAALANVSQIERIVLAAGTNNIVLADAFVSSATGARVMVTGASGDDTIDGSGLTMANALDVIAGMGSDTLSGGDGADTFAFDLPALTAADIVTGGAGTDTLRLQTGGVVAAASLKGVGGVETFVLADDATQLTLPQSVYVSSTNHVLTVSGGSGDDVIDARALKAVAGSGQGTLNIYGGAGDDVIAGSSSNPELPPGFYILRNFVDGGTGRDTISISNSDRATVVYDPNDVRAFVSTGLLIVNGAASINVANASDQSLGDDCITRGFVDVDASASLEAVTIAGNGAGSIVGGAGADVLSNARSIAGGAGADTMIGIKDSNGCSFSIGAGDFASGESILGRTGNDSLYVAGDADMTTGTVTGIRYLTLGGGSLILGADEISDLYYISGGGTLTVKVGTDRQLALHDLYGGDPSFILNVVGTSGADTIAVGNGDGLDPTVHAGSGNDILTGSGLLYGDGGNDRIEYGSYRGASFIDGGDGNDTLTPGYYASVTLRLAVAADQSTNDHTTVRGIENVDYSDTDNGTIRCIGSDSANKLIGGRDDDKLDGAGGDDFIGGGYGDNILTGGAGADRFMISGGSDKITDFTPGEDRLVLSRYDDSGDTIFAGSGFGKLVTVADTATSIAGADLVIFTASHLNSIDDVAKYLRASGTGLRDEGLFVAGRDDHNHVLLFYAFDASGQQGVYQPTIDLGVFEPTTLQLTDFSFI